MSSLLRYLFSLLLAVGLLSGCVTSKLVTAADSPWEPVPLDVRSSALDVAFSDADHGFLVGSNRLIMETQDAGRHWQEQSLDLPGDENFRLISIAFDGEEGWLAGQPGLLMHSSDAGQSWTRLLLDVKLPGDPYLVTALGPGQAELATTVGAIYATEDGGEHWSALVRDSLGAIRDLRRGPDGRYVSVSSLGNFYGEWARGDAAWSPRQRPSSQRIQAMGFGPDGQLWMLNRGAQIRLGATETTAAENTAEDAADTADGGSAFQEPLIPITNGYGYLDMAWAPDGSIWTGGGNGTLLSSRDDGASWQRDPVGEQQPSTFTRVLFLADGKGFVLGERGNLLRWMG